ncbi:methyltransferase, TIGR04325 family [Dokdonella immobilis]|uniref:Putative methyltransferase, LIC12133 family n=1 Tax=Dokdonella immobilis TaxID=578942 RepID=A0A1I4VFG6_9GAMM|nr:methyltransferase, TIGR04325 family [Dokdonella immobilis]SFM99823.1 putative methyltransferase, LIC12133 family [Dokdonella immobilis]
MGVQRSRIRRIINEISELPGLNLLARPLYRRRFRAHRRGNAYYGVYASFEAARADIPPGLPPDYNTAAAAELYEQRLSRLEASDYPALYWLQRMLGEGCRRIVDLGGHVGLSYYAFQPYLDYPRDLLWQVHDVPAVMEKGRALCAERGEQRRLAFVDLDAVDGCDVLMAKGALQYLDYSLVELLKAQRVLPRRLLVNLTPMHPDRSFFTLQNIGVAVCPYRIGAVPEFLHGIRALGYRLIERWEHLDRSVQIPFCPEYSIDRYHGMCFSLE